MFYDICFNLLTIFNYLFRPKFPKIPRHSGIFYHVCFKGASTSISLIVHRVHSVSTTNTNMVLITLHPIRTN